MAPYIVVFLVFFDIIFLREEWDACLFISIIVDDVTGLKVRDVINNDGDKKTCILFLPQEDNVKEDKEDNYVRRHPLFCHFL